VPAKPVAEQTIAVHAAALTPANVPPTPEQVTAPPPEKPGLHITVTESPEKPLIESVAALSELATCVAVQGASWAHVTAPHTPLPAAMPPTEHVMVLVDTV
jgi:hypothetical protein